MSSSPADDRTTIIATYSTRRDADMARDYLADAGLQTFVSSDDAGGMHPQMQRPHGVKLIGMEETAPQARTNLEEAGLLPDDEQVEPASGDDAQTIDSESSPSGWAFTGAAVVIVGLVLLAMLLLGAV